MRTNTARQVAWAATAAVAVRGISGTSHVRASMEWLRAFEDNHRCDIAATPAAAQIEPDSPHFVIILPVLREQRLLPEMMEHFARMAATWPSVSLAVVTTEREHRDAEKARLRLAELAKAVHAGWPAHRVESHFAGVLPTDQMHGLASGISGRPYMECVVAAQELFDALPLTPRLAAEATRAARDSGIDAHHYHHPHPQARMSQQINLAVAEEGRRLTAAGLDRSRLWMVVYNADSRPDLASLPAAADLIDRGDGRVRVMQQSALFTANLPGMPASRRGAVLVGAALLQSRWTLAREIPRLRRQAKGGRRWWPPLAHCVGHGLFAHVDTFTGLGGLPEVTMNEDLPFGYLACAAGVPIHPLPVLEWADTPETVPGTIRQARQWFWSYIDYPSVAGIAARAGYGTRWSRSALAAQGLARGVLWLGQSPAIAACLALPLLDRRPRAVLASACALGAYQMAPFVLLGRHPRVRDALGHRVGLRELAGGLAALMTSSAGPWWCTANAVHRRVSGAFYDHDKTER